jgi:hypothetical protein
VILFVNVLQISSYLRFEQDENMKPHFPPAAAAAAVVILLQALVAKLKGSSSAAGSSAAPGTAPGSSSTITPGSISSSSIGGAPGSSSTALSKDAKGAVSAEAGVIKSVLATLGTLAQQAGTSFKPYVSEVMPLVIEAIQVGGMLR